MKAFENAHNKTKSNKYIKKHFKQLLEGFKENDTQAIKTADKNYKDHENTSNDSYGSEGITDYPSVIEPVIEEDLSNSSVCTDDASDIMSSDNEDSNFSHDIFSKINNYSQELSINKITSNLPQQIDPESMMLETVQEEESECEYDEECVPVNTSNTDVPKVLVSAEFMSTESDMTSDSSQEKEPLKSDVHNKKSGDFARNEDSPSSSSISENNTNDLEPSETELLELFDTDGGLAINIKKRLFLNDKVKSEPGKFVKLKRKFDKEPSLKTDSEYEENETIINNTKPKRAKISSISISSLQKGPFTQLDDVLENYKYSTYKLISFQNKEYSFLDDINKACKNTLDFQINEVEPHSSANRLSKTVIRSSNLVDKPNTVDGPPKKVKRLPHTVEIFNTDISEVNLPSAAVQSNMVVVNPPANQLNAPTIMKNPIAKQEELHNIVVNQVLNSVNVKNSNENIEIQPNYQNTLVDENDIIISDFSEDDPENTNLEERIKVFCHKTTCIIVLKHPAELYINGKVKVRCLAGKAQISGYMLTDVFSEIYSPNYNYSQSIKTVENENVYYGLFNKLTSIGLSVNDVEDLVISLGKQDVVLCFQPLRSRKYDFLEKNFSKTNIFSKINKNVDTFLQQASNLLNCSLFSTRPFKCFVINPVWEQTFQSDSTHPARGIICGGKGVGKSTFLRYFVNKKLSSGPVLVIDLDPGQCEFTVAGNVSAILVDKPLLGPNFTHLSKPDLMLNIGLINVMDNVRRYVKAVSILLDFCHSKEEYKNVPWIVNTMGMCNVTGQLLFHYITLKLQPTFLIQIESDNIKKRFECHLYANKVKEAYFDIHHSNNLFNDISHKLVDNLDYSFILCQEDKINIKHNSWLTPKDERYLSVLSYFGELLLQNKKKDFFGIIPYELPLDKINIISNVDIDSSNIHRILNGKIVGLCSGPELCNKVVKLKDDPVVCYGYGLIRGVDTTLGRVYIATPVPDTRAPSLLYADWTPELITEPVVALGTPVPYRAPTLQGHDQLMQSPQRRFNPLQLLKLIRAT